MASLNFSAISFKTISTYCVNRLSKWELNVNVDVRHLSKEKTCPGPKKNNFC